MSKFLVGKTIKGLKISDDQQALLFECNDGMHVAKCEDDCCSYTWVEHIELPVLGFPANVLMVVICRGLMTFFMVEFMGKIFQNKNG